MKPDINLENGQRNLQKKFPGCEVMYTSLDEQEYRIKVCFPGGKTIDDVCRMGRRQKTPFQRQCRALGFLKQLLRKHYKGKNPK